MGRRPSADRGTHVGGWWLSLLVSMLVVPGVTDAQQVVGISVGQFSVVSESSRSTDDVLRANRGFQTFDIGDFDNIIVGGDWMLAFGDYVEAGAGLEFYQRSVSGAQPVDEATTGSSLAVDMTVRTVSVPITARLFPLTRDAHVQPYVGGGATVHFWRYTEERVLTVGSFSGQSSAIDQGITAGPVIFGGARVPVGAVSIGGEVRYRARDARLNGPVFAGTTLKLGGISTVATIQFRIP